MYKLLWKISRENENFKTNVDETLSKLVDVLNKITEKSCPRIVNISSELLETLEIIKNCTICKRNITIKRNMLNNFYESINEIKHLLIKLEKEEHSLIKNLYKNWN